jgi:hypothetical protein
MEHHLRSICIFVLAFISLKDSAQAYRPLLSSNATWQDEHGWANPGPSTSSSECLRYYLDGDSMVDGSSYQILRRSSIFASVFDGSYVGLLREDTAQRSVYIYRSHLIGDELLYMFPRQLGPYPSTYRYGPLPEWDTLEVVNIDTVWLSDEPHIRSTLSNGDTLIEGIGSVFAFMPSTQWGEIHWWARLICYSLNGTVVFSAPHFFCGCELPVGVNPVAEHPIRIHPSPTDGLCYLTGAPANTRFVVRSLDGRTVLIGASSINGTSEINMSNLPASLYFIEILNKRNPEILKIIKQ